MALKLHFPFPIFAPPPLPPLNPSPNPNTNQSHHRPATEVRFSRWNNANAAEFNERRRAQKEIEDDIRRHRRFDSATRIAENHETDTLTNPPNNEGFKSLGTPSSPSSPSIPGKKSKYSKDPNSHPAFRKVIKTHKIPIKPPQRPVPPQANLTIRDDGISYVIEGAPFEFKYSYTETPKVKPIKLREPPFAPFGPTTTARPWTGRAPLPPSKKKLKEFDSFKLPPPHKKGVKPVQAPGPFLAGSGPRYTRSREEILGEPLTKEEIKDLVDGCLKSKRQLNMGRDGLTHNMLDNIHAHWKRRRVCKIKCKGVCTVDMDNVRQQLEERTGGKIIYGKGGVIFLFRGRNYNYRTRPRFPLMLWKPVTPVYPRLVKQVPEGLTIKEATEMRKKGRNLISICKLGKNGVYCDLVNHVREAFGECELVRINCQGMNPSDYKKIGGKLKDLVPCVLISFESEHILMWRGRNWESSLPKLENDHEESKKSNVDDATCVALPLEDTEMSASYVPTISVKDASRETLDTSMSSMGSMDVDVEGSEDLYSIQNVKPSVGTDAVSTVGKTNGSETISDITGCSDDEPEPKRNTCETATMLDPIGVDDESEPTSNEYGNDAILDNTGCAQKGLEALTVDPITHDKLLDVSEEVQDLNPPPRLSTPCTEGVLLLQKQAVDNGSAVILDDSALDADIIYQRAVAVAKSAPPGPVFRHRFRKEAVKKPEEQETGDLKEEERTTVSPGDLKEEESTRVSAEKRIEKKKKTANSVSIKKETVFDEIYNDVVPQGSLRVDELAKLLA